jgi:hypothetical protein
MLSLLTQSLEILHNTLDEIQLEQETRLEYLRKNRKKLVALEAAKKLQQRLKEMEDEKRNKKR